MAGPPITDPITGEQIPGPPDISYMPGYRQAVAEWNSKYSKRYYELMESQKHPTGLEPQNTQPQSNWKATADGKWEWVGKPYPGWRWDSATAKWVADPSTAPRNTQQSPQGSSSSYQYPTSQEYRPDQQRPWASIAMDRYRTEAQKNAQAWKNYNTAQAQATKQVAQEDKNNAWMDLVNQQISDPAKRNIHMIGSNVYLNTKKINGVTYKWDGQRWAPLNEPRDISRDRYTGDIEPKT